MTTFHRRTLRPIFAIAKVSFHEILRDKALYNIILFALLLFGVSFAASELSWLTPERVILDIGFSAINISCAMVAVMNGCAMFAKEFDRRTIFVALARPITRLQFAWGKFLGLCGIVALNWLLLALMEAALFKMQGGMINTSFVIALIFLLLQSWVLGALSVFVSSFTTTSIAVIILIGTYMIGNNVSALLELVNKVQEPTMKSILKSGTYLIPNLEHFNLGFHVTYLLPIPGKMIATSITYTALITGLALYFSGKLLDQREA